MNTKFIAGLSFASLSVALLCGCTADGNMVASERFKTELVGTDAMELGQPAVRQTDGMLHVTGSVRRPDHSPMNSPGHVHVQVIDGAGGHPVSAQARYETPAGRSTPRTPEPRIAEYDAHLPGPLPEGATVRVVVCVDGHPSSGETE